MELLKLWDCFCSVSCITTQVTSALILGMVLFLVASGLSLIFGVLGVMNFAHGSLYMLGAYLTYTLLTLQGNFGVTVLLASIGVGVFGVVAGRIHPPAGGPQPDLQRPKGGSHVNGLEGFWGYLKRRLAAKGGIRRERLPLYLAEYVWRYNHRKLSAQEQVRSLLNLLQS